MAVEMAQLKANFQIVVYLKYMVCNKFEKDCP